MGTQGGKLKTKLKGKNSKYRKIVRFSEIDLQLCINEDPLLLSIKITVIGHLNELRTCKIDED